jgi:aminobenzoyl-glutamate utilization protein B
VPAGSLNFPSAIPGIEAHEWKAAVFPTSSISHKGQVVGAKTLAASIIDLLTTSEVLQKARAEFEVESKKTPYFSLVPPDAKPDVDLNRAEMERYRADMKKLYLNKTPRFN